MKETLAVINAMQRQGVIETYALGGAVALLFYTEPVLTYDLDVFVFLPQPTATSQRLVSLSPVYHYLRAKGYRSDKEHVLIEGVPVQFIPAYNPLVEEAVRKAAAVKYQGVKTRVLRVEYLVAILVQTGRPKDRTRLAQLFAEVRIKNDMLSAILKRYRLTEKWNAIRRQLETKG